MNYDFIEIGTSDFDTLIQESTNEQGLSIEPLKYYLDHLPNKENVKKVNAAISDRDGEIDIYYISEEKIIEYSLPYWIRGCNSINKPQAFAVKQIGKDLYDKIVTIEKVPMMSWKTLIQDYNITGIKYLKIDTEGHDHVILKDYLKECKKDLRLFADKIRIEYHSDISDISAIDNLLTEFINYSIRKEEMDIILTKNDKYEKAYVLYANEVYIPTLQVCVNSLNQFSNIPIIVYLINSDRKINGALSINWKCDVPEIDHQNDYIDRLDSSIYRLLIQRPLIVKDALINYANTVAYIDSDCVATPYCDNIFDYFPENNKFPYFTLGMYDYMLINGKGGPGNSLEAPACELFNIDESVRKEYRQTGFFVAGEHCIHFLNMWYHMCTHPEIMTNNALYAPYNEETILNTLLFKYNIHEGLPLVYTNISLKDMYRIENNYGKELQMWMKLPDSKEELMFLHGEKDPEIMNKMTSSLKGSLQIDETKSLRIIYLAPHLSTGGCPAFILKRIETLKKYTDVEIFVVEYECYSLDYVVQRNAIINIVGENFKTLYENKLELFDIIDQWKPDIIHIDEMSERMDREMIKRLYNNKREYRIIETCHNISFLPENKVFHPDCYFFCTPYHLETFAKLPSSKAMIPFPIDKHVVTKAEKRKYKIELGMEVYKTHVLNIGLWTPGKNQKEGIEIAKKYPEMQFHFVGNMAGNFQEYWKPLMKYLPENVIIHGERDDVYKFMNACDIFMFNSTFECNPLVLREAISYSLPIIARNLPQYMDMFTKYIHSIDTDLNTIKADYEVPEDNTSEDFANNHFTLYNKIKNSPVLITNTNKITIIQYFVEQPFLEIKGESDSDFRVQFFDENDVLYHEQIIKSYHWIKLNRRYYTNWRTVIHQDGELIYDERLALEGKRVFIVLDSDALGDNLAWIPYCEEFRLKHQCHVIVCTEKNFLFKKVYPELEFVERGVTVENIYAQYFIGTYTENTHIPIPHNTIPLQQVASSILGIEHKEQLARIDFTPKKRIYHFKYVAIVTNSTAGMKFWKKEYWEELAEYLQTKGYKVINVSKERNPLNNIEQITDTSLENTMHVIHHSEFVIGLSSGLIWLSHMLDKHVVMLANFSESWCEFQENCTRITNTDVCHGCFNNPNFTFDRSWDFCPIWKNTPRQYECQNNLSVELVIKNIQHFLPKEH